MNVFIVVVAVMSAEGVEVVEYLRHPSRVVGGWRRDDGQLMQFWTEEIPDIVRKHGKTRMWFSLQLHDRSGTGYEDGVSFRAMSVGMI